MSRLFKPIFAALWLFYGFIERSACNSIPGNSTVNLGALRPNFECVIRGGAPVTECAQALLQFPKDASPAGFRQIGSSPHRYLLPQIQIYPPRRTGACGVKVDFPDPSAHREDTSSWATIISTGSLLIQACSAPGQGYIAGWASVGDGEYMRISIMDSRYMHVTAGDVHAVAR